MKQDPSTESKQPPTEPAPSRAPVDTASCFSWTFMIWVNNLIKTGYEHPLEFEDLWPTSEQDRVQILHDEFWSGSDEQQQETTGRRLWRQFYPELRNGALLYITFVACSLGSPLLLWAIVDNLQINNYAETDFGRGLLLVLALFVLQVVAAITQGLSDFVSVRMATRTRTALISSVYQRMLLLDPSARSAASKGIIVNLVSVDAMKLVELAHMIHRVWTAPIIVLAAFAAVITLVGWSGLVGFALMLLSIPATKKLGQLQMRVGKARIQASDRRVSLITEILQGIKVLKLYAWEVAMQTKLDAAREEELTSLRTFTLTKALSIPVAMCVPPIASVATFITYVLQGGDLDAATAFTVVSFFVLVRMPFTILPMALPLFADCIVSFDRFSAFFALSVQPLEAFARPRATAERPAHLQIQQGDFRYEVQAEAKPEQGQDNPCVQQDPGSQGELTLAGIELEVNQCTLVAVVGSVGSGKSSLLQAVLGEIPRVSGSVGLAGSVALVNQTPYIFNGSLRSNVLFGAPMDEHRYNDCLRAAALLPDLELLSNADLTEIGDRGVTLSGGQKARVSLARALYSDADVVLLDDTLAAVDAHVAGWLVSNAILGKLGNKIVLFCTNHVHLLPSSTRMIVLQDGKIAADGPKSSVLLDADFISEHTPEHPEQDSAVQHALRDAKSVVLAPSTSLVKEELRIRGDVDSTVYKAYAASGVPRPKKLLLAGLGLVLVFSELSWVSVDLWLALWSSDVFDQDTHWYIAIYAALAVGVLLSWAAKGVCFALFGVHSARELHREMLDSVLRCPVLFFESTPMGRLLSRFSKDTMELDLHLPDKWQWLCATSLRVISILALISVSAWPFLFAVPLVFVLYWNIHRFYRHTARELQRLENLSRSPLTSQISESIEGYATIRAYSAVKQHIETHIQLLERNGQALLSLKTAEVWLAQRLMMVGAGVVLLCALCLVLMKKLGSVNAGLAGLALAYSFNIVVNLNMVVRNSADVEAKMSSVERVLEYSELEPEAPRVLEPRPAPSWPAQGHVLFQDVCMRYRPGLPLVLQGVNCEIKPGQRVGVCGRSGAGKSSMLTALYRVVELDSGSILIDGVDIAKIGMHDLRSKLTIVPQEATLFTGNIRSNVDIAGKCTDEQVWHALEECGMDGMVKGIAQHDSEGKLVNRGLDSLVEESGSNLSAGQRQLLCLARAILRESKLICLDEATASVDDQTDAMLQRTIRRCFASSTTLTIAHRLETIMDSDAILVMGEGVVQERGSPAELLKDPQGMLTALVNETGASSALRIRESVALRESEAGSATAAAPTTSADTQVGGATTVEAQL